jgi:hypothetical protein
MVPSLPKLDQHEEMVEQGSTGGHPYEYLTEVDKDGRLEDGVGCKVLKLEPELLQQQQEERRDRQRQPAGEVGDEQHELPGGEIVEGSGASADPPGERRRAPSEQVAHQVEHSLRLETLGMAKRSHGLCGGASAEQRNTKAKERNGARRQRGAVDWKRMQKDNCCTRGEPFFKETRVLAVQKPFRAPLNRRRRSRVTGT